jgi:hypothetical protein
LSFPGRKSQGDEAISGLIEYEYNVDPLAHGELATNLADAGGADRLDTDGSAIR